MRIGMNGVAAPGQGARDGDTGKAKAAAIAPAETQGMPQAGVLSALSLMGSKPGRGPIFDQRQQRNLGVKADVEAPASRDPGHGATRGLSAHLPDDGEILYGGCAGSKSFRSEAADDVEHDVAVSSHPSTGYRVPNVPYVSQEGDPAGCWYACARMLGHHAEAGPRLGVPQRFDSRTGELRGIRAQDMELFIRNENLMTVGLPHSHEFEADDLEALLRRRGPIMFGWKSASGEGARHMSVITGIDRESNTVFFHDPSPRRGPDQEMSLDKFNRRLAWDMPNAMLQRYR